MELAARLRESVDGSTWPKRTRVDFKHVDSKHVGDPSAIDSLDAAFKLSVGLAELDSRPIHAGDRLRFRPPWARELRRINGLSVSGRSWQLSAVPRRISADFA